MPNRKVSVELVVPCEDLDVGSPYFDWVASGGSPPGCPPLPHWSRPGIGPRIQHRKTGGGVLDDFGFEARLLLLGRQDEVHGLYPEVEPMIGSGELSHRYNQDIDVLISHGPPFEAGLTDLNTGFDSPLICHFSPEDFLTVVDRCEFMGCCSALSLLRLGFLRRLRHGAARRGAAQIYLRCCVPLKGNMNHFFVCEDTGDGLFGYTSHSGEP